MGGGDASLAVVLWRWLGGIGWGADKISLQYFAPSTSSPQVVSTFGQLYDPGGGQAPRLRQHITLNLSAESLPVFAPSTGVIEFVPTFIELKDCVLVTPKARSDGEDFASLEAGLSKAGGLGFALCNMDADGSLREEIGRIIAKGFTDTSAVTTETATNRLLNPADADHENFRYLDACGPPETDSLTKLGTATAGSLDVAVFLWEDGDEDGFALPREVKFFNPLPHLLGILPPGLFQEQRPTIAAVVVDCSAASDFSSTTPLRFDPVTHEVPAATPLTGFLRFRFTLTAPSVAPYEIAYAISKAGVLANSCRFRLNASRGLRGTRLRK